MMTLEEAKKDYELRRKIRKAKSKKKTCSNCAFSTYKRAGMESVLWCCVMEEFISFEWTRAKFCRYYKK